MSSCKVSTKEAAARQECLDTLGDFIEKCQEDITNMLDTLGWTPEHFMQPRNQCVCPYNSNHRMSKSSLEKHKTICEIVSQGYSKADAEKIIEDTSQYYKDASCVYSVKLDLNTVNSVLWNHHVQNHSVFYGYKKVAQTAEEEQQLMSREDRLGMAEYIIKRAKEANRLKELGQDELLVSANLADLIKKDGDERQLDPVEEMAALRDYRRRRQTYRAKNVHITKKSHTEIMREVINNQMEMYTQSVMEETGHIQQHQMLDNESIDQCGRSKNREREGSSRPDREDTCRYERDGRYPRSRSRSRDRSSRRAYRKSRSMSRERYSKPRDRYKDDCSARVDRSTRDDRSECDSLSNKDDQSRHRSRSISEDRKGSKHKRRHRSRSKSSSSERSKKSKRKKHKHKHKKHKKSERKIAAENSEDERSNKDNTGIDIGKEDDNI